MAVDTPSIDPIDPTYLVDGNGTPQLPEAPTFYDLAAGVAFCNQYYGMGDSGSAFESQCADSWYEVRVWLGKWVSEGADGTTIEQIAAIPGMTRKEIREALSVQPARRAA